MQPETAGVPVPEPKPETAPPAPPAKPLTLIQKLAAVMATIDRVQKRGRNENHNYDYATEADIVAAVRAGLSQHGVMFLLKNQSLAWDTLSTRSGGQQRLCTITAQFVFVDGETGETLEIPMVGQGSDSGDKAFYKALTGAVKYALLKTFLIPTGDDPENEPPPANQETDRQRRERQNGEAFDRGAARGKAEREARERNGSTSSTAKTAPAKTKEEIEAEQAATHRRAIYARVVKACRAKQMADDAIKKWVVSVIGLEKKGTDLTLDELKTLEKAIAA